MASVIVIRTGTQDYIWHLMGVASNWENAKRLAAIDANDTIEWDGDNDMEFGVQEGRGEFGRKYRLDFCKVGTRNDFQMPADF
jgi:hypothetical protein